MTAGGTERKRGRPRAFDTEQALAQAAAMFAHEGYDRVSLPDLTRAMGINPPSLYAAFGSKADLFGRIVAQERQRWCDDIAAAFSAGRTVDAALANLLAHAAHRVVAPEVAGRGGGLIWEGTTNSADTPAIAHVRQARLAIAAALWRGIARERPESAAQLTDVMMAQIAGLSAMAREGTEIERLLALARAMAASLHI